MRVILFIAVIALFVDAFFYSGAHTQAAFIYVSRAAEQFADYISETVIVEPGGNGTTTEP